MEMSNDILDLLAFSSEAAGVFYTVLRMHNFDVTKVTVQEND